MGYGLEVDMIRHARGLDLLTCVYVFDTDSAERMTDAGADLVVAHLGLTTSGSIGAQTSVTLEEAPARVAAIRDAARGVRRDVLVLCHGGPLADADDAEYVLSRTPGVDGFLGASSIERLATERAIEKETRRFRELKLAQPKVSRKGRPKT
jgi:predicted TIM-barrel enzyme